MACMCSEIVISYYFARVIMPRRGLLEVLLYRENTLEMALVKYCVEISTGFTAVQNRMISAENIHLIMNTIICTLIIKTNKCTNMYCIIVKHKLKHLKAPTCFDLSIIIREHM
jgi:hypothetical protein